MVRLSDGAADIRSTSIGRGCYGSAPGGFCTFDELMSDLQRDSAPWTGTTTIGTQREPDVYAAVNELRRTGCANNMAPWKLFDQVFGPNDTPRFETQWVEVCCTIGSRLVAPKHHIHGFRHTHLQQLDIR